MDYYKRVSFIYVSCMFMVLLMMIPSSATIINVPADYSTIQAGIDASSDGDTVLVQPGTYMENINFNGHNIVLGSLFLTTGDTSYIEQTVIDGDSSGSVVIFENDEDSTAVITGFTIQNGWAYYSGGGIRCDYSSPTIANNLILRNVSGSLNNDSEGGGIACCGSNAIIIGNTIEDNYSVEYSGGGGISCILQTPKIINNKIFGNRAYVGGGIYCNHSTPVIESNIIFENEASRGGGIDTRNGGYPIIVNNTIFGNSAIRGAGITLFSNVTLNNNTISGNIALFCGGGIYCDHSTYNIISIEHNHINENISIYGGGICLTGSGPSIIIQFNILKDNYAEGIGGGIDCNVRTEPIIQNNIFFGNISSTGGGLSCRINSSPIIINNIFYADSAENGSEISVSGGDPQIYYNNIQDGWPGEGNIDIDPLFRDPGNGDYHLMATYCGDPYDSPCIDMGHPDLLDSLLDCDWGLGTERSDIGAYGGGADRVGIDEHTIMIPGHYILSQNYPNPFNAQTTIQYTLPKTSDVVIDIYDILGRKVETLLNIKLQAGNHQVIWNATDKSSGMYFYKIQAGDYIETKKMLLLK